MLFTLLMLLAPLKLFKPLLNPHILTEPLCGDFWYIGLFGDVIGDAVPLADTDGVIVAPDPDTDPDVAVVAVVVVVAAAAVEEEEEEEAEVEAEEPEEAAAAAAAIAISWVMSPFLLIAISSAHLSPD